MEWLLVAYIYAGMLAKGDSVALTNVAAFTTEAECRAAGEQMRPLVSGTTKEFRFACVARKVRA